MIDGLKLHGLAELDQALYELPRAAAKTTLRRTATRALQPMAEEARRRAPDDPRTPAPKDLKSSIRIGARAQAGRAAKKLREGKSSVVVFMGPSRDGYPQAVVQEFGAAPHAITKGTGKRGKGPRGRGRKHPGHAAHPYMRPAFDNGWRGALASLARLLGEEIHKTTRRLEAKARRLAKKG